MSKLKVKKEIEWTAIEDGTPKPFELIDLLHENGKISSGWAVGGRRERTNFDGAIRTKSPIKAWRGKNDVQYVKGDRFEQTRYV